MLKWLFRRKDRRPQSVEECFQLGTQLAKRAPLDALERFIESVVA